MVDFEDILRERINRATPLNIEVSNARLYEDELITLQDVITVARVLQRHNCNNDVMFPADLGLPISVEFNGGLLMGELAGHEVASMQLAALKELAALEFEVYVYFGEDDTSYFIDKEFNVKRVSSRGTYGPHL